VIEGDTIEIDGHRIRILDIDAPELEQSCIGADGSAWPCGRSAALALSNWIGARRVDCTIEDQDSTDLDRARCIVDGREDVATWLAENGHAAPYKDCTCTRVIPVSQGPQDLGQAAFG
jgi:endonuclease YncB( thermonuclease family)